MSIVDGLVEQSSPSCTAEKDHVLSANAVFCNHSFMVRVNAVASPAFIESLGRDNFSLLKSSFGISEAIPMAEVGEMLGTPALAPPERGPNEGSLPGTPDGIVVPGRCWSCCC